MAERTRRPADEQDLDVPEEDSERGIAEEEDEFDEDAEEDEDEDDEMDLPRESGAAKEFTAEIGSEGGSAGDLESSRRQPRVMRGSEATTTAGLDEERRFDDRHAGGAEPGRRD